MEILHPALGVSDLDDAVDFYETLLGLHRTREAEIDGQRHIFLGGAGSAELQLIEVEGPVEPSGFDHVAVAADDVDALVTTATDEWGSEVVMEPRSLGDARLAFITDPDGYHVELIEESESGA